MSDLPILMWIAKGSLILLMGFAVAPLLRSAATRHALWFVALAAQLVVPAAGLLPRKIEVTVPLPPATATATETAARQWSTRVLSGTSDPVVAPTRAVPLLPLIWSAGAAFVLLRLLIGFTEVARIARSSRRAGDPRWHLGRIRALVSDSILIPVTCGIFRPVILLPPDAESWDDATTRQVQLHETAHVRRLDVLTQTIGQCVVALFWFQPLAWLALRRMCAEAEHASDDAVLREGIAPSSYASTLFTLARRAHRLPVPGIARTELEMRVRALTRPERVEIARRARRPVAAAAAACVAVLPLAALEPSRMSIGFQCSATVIDSSDVHEMNGRLRLDDGVTRHYFFLRPAANRCIEAWFPLDAHFSKDDGDVAATPQLHALIREKVGSTDRTLLLDEHGGRLRRRFLVNGRDAAWDSDAVRWYAGLLPDVIRRTTAGAQERTSRILQRGGIEAVFAEIEAIPLLQIRREYLVALLDLTSPQSLPRDRLSAFAREQLQAYPPLFEDFTRALAQREQ